MGFNCGIVGLPNVGKSTLFNALTATMAAESANYPFCTIEPNKGRVLVPDPRLEAIAAIAGSAKVIPTQLEFVDIAGLVKGASKGEGLGNQFLANIRETDAILHVLRCFDGEVTHSEGSVDPIRDAEIIETELMLADLESCEKRVVSLEKRARGNEKEAKETLELLYPIVAALREGQTARSVSFPDDKHAQVQQLQLLTSKPVLYLCNVGEEDAASGNAYTQKVADFAAQQGASSVLVSAEIESQISLLPPEEQREFLDELELKEPGLTRLIRAGYALLQLITFFTCGPKEARAWTVAAGASAPQAAGVIHSDFERGFIRAETIAYDDYIACQGEQGAREAGKMRQEGKEYKVQDGDIFHFKFNV